MEPSYTDSSIGGKSARSCTTIRSNESKLLEMSPLASDHKNSLPKSTYCPAVIQRRLGDKACMVKRVGKQIGRSGRCVHYILNTAETQTLECSIRQQRIQQCIARTFHLVRNSRSSIFRIHDARRVIRKLLLAKRDVHFVNVINKRRKPVIPGRRTVLLLASKLRILGGERQMRVAQRL